MIQLTRNGILKSNFNQFIRKVTTKSHLASNPFNVENMQMIRESKNQFPKPNFISFDLFGTLYYPKKSIPEQYYDISKHEFGISLPAQTIAEKFPKIYKEMMIEYPNYGKGNPKFENTDSWWEELIKRIYKTNDSKIDDEKLNALAYRLIHHFTSNEAYSLYPDVLPTLKFLKNKGVRLVACSNSDERALTILESLGIKQFFHCNEILHCDNVFLSYNLDHLKGEKIFYDKVAMIEYKSEINSNYSKKHVPVEFLTGCYQIGDNYNEDFIGSIKAGWNGVLLDRNGSHSLNLTKNRESNPKYDACALSSQEKELSNNNDEDDNEPLVLANNRIVITNLEQLLKLFDWN
ncbi:uncharacterized protein KGF55_001786 [Candida pseudojiufengensis]|uniref:uncharacterized protein n=1 Tax=Candida pseudojiufengensis TaxID=497109 RepID=UPI002225B078|nr:uncharacterized protein KGF55_001786 [Candida pseudojiufengensis]KAI5964717.1 hypothetical protein KGF55_001786 [Candida pseudojiufengensis]